MKNHITVDKLKTKVGLILHGEKKASVYMFGSYAKNKQHENSDVDMLVVADEKRRANQIVMELYRNMSDIAVDYDILGYPISTFKKRSESNEFLQRIITEGILLYGKRI